MKTPSQQTAVKSISRSAAPDMLIRDSYRTDTLIPLARPIGKYRKTGITALPSSRGVSKCYGDAEGRTSCHSARTGGSCDHNGAFGGWEDTRRDRECHSTLHRHYLDPWM